MARPPELRTGPLAAASNLGQYGAIRAFEWLFGAFPPEQNLRTASSFADAWCALNRRRLGRATANVRRSLPGLDARRAEEIARESVRSMFRAYMVDAFQLPRLLTEESWPHVIDLSGARDGVEVMIGERPAIFLAPHAGNWELLGFFPTIMGFRMHALARPLDNPLIWEWAVAKRETRGMRIITKFGATEELQAVIARGGRIALVADQDAGPDGVFVPFFGQMASAYKSVALLAIRYGLPVVVGAALRDGPGFRYRLHTTDVIRPEDWAPHDDPVFYVTARYNRAMEQAASIDPGQYLWIHRRWKSRPRWERDGKPMPDRVREKLLSLPWMAETDVDRVAEDSRQRVAEASGAAA